MVWFILLVAVAITVLVITNRLQAVEDRVIDFVDRARGAWEYMNEDREETEREIREALRRQAEEARAAEGTAEPRFDPATDHRAG